MVYLSMSYLSSKDVRSSIEYLRSVLFPTNIIVASGQHYFTSFSHLNIKLKIHRRQHVEKIIDHLLRI
jgi:hypothetical protein